MRKENKKTANRVLAALMAVPVVLSGFGSAAVFASEEEHPYWVSDETVTFSFMTSEGASQTIPTESASREALLDATNVKLDVQTAPAASYKEKMNISLGTNNFADIIYLDGGMTTIAQYASDGIFEPLMQYVNEETMPNFYKKWTENPEMKKYLVEGELYAFPVIQKNESTSGFSPVIRTDLLEENDIPIPTTFDELLDALTKLKEIYPDSIPWIGRKGTLQLLATSSYMLGSGFGSRNNPMYWDADEEKYIFGPADENFKEVLSYLNRAYEAGVLDPEFATQTQETMEANLQSGKSFFYLDNSGFGLNYEQTLRQIEGQENGTFMPLGTLENSLGEKRAVAYARDLAGRFYGINAGCDNMEEMIKFIDFMYSDEGFNISNYGKEGYSYEIDADGNPQYIQSYLEQFKGAQPSSYYAVFSDLGVGKLDFTLWASNSEVTSQIQKALGELTPEAEAYYNVLEEDEGYVEPHIDPSFTTEESEQIADILADVTTYLETQYNDFIMGVKDISEWDDVIAELESRDIRTLEDIYNQAEARTAEE